MREQRLDLQTPDGTLDLHVFQPDEGHTRAAVILYMDAFGVRPALGSMARRLAEGGYLVAIPNLYYRSGPFAPFDPAQVFDEGPERKRFKGMIASISDSMVMRDTALVIGAIDEERRTGDRTRFAALGYCMGGGFALSAAGAFPDRMAAAACFHGGSLATDKPDSPHLLAPRIRGRVYIGVAAVDPSFSREQQTRLQAALDDAGVNYVLETYEGARHGFAVTGHPAYNHAAAERHWQTLTQFLNDTFS
jgi:carboxymethylenebutenolidase